MFSTQLNFLVQGDSGGALQCQIPVGHESFQRCNGWFVRGITSFGKGCNRIGSPGVYVDLSTTGILMWIYDWIKVNPFLFQLLTPRLPGWTRESNRLKNRFLGGTLFFESAS